MDSEMASTAPSSQPLQYMMVTTRQTMPAGWRVAAGTGPAARPWSAPGEWAQLQLSLHPGWQERQEPGLEGGDNCSTELNAAPEGHLLPLEVQVPKGLLAWVEAVMRATG